MVRASTVEEVQAAVRNHARLRPVAGGTKPALSTAPPDVTPLDVSALAGIVDFSPAECTFTARPGTPIAEIERLLASHGLYLPFEPPLAARGATLGGTVCAGLSGPGRFRYGGVRDFLLGVHVVDGTGRIVCGGGRVVKNAAGFSLHHLMLGSLGRLGVLVDVTCKVFPRPRTHVTLSAECGTLARALETLGRLRRSTFEVDAAELLPPSTLLLRIAGLEAALDERAAGLAAFLAPAEVRRLSADEADAAWHAARELTDIDTGGPHTLIKVAITPSRIAAFEERLPPLSQAPRRYSAGGDLAWIGWPSPVDTLDRLLADLGLSGLVLIDPAGTPESAARSDTAAGASTLPADPFIGKRPDARFLGRVRQALDPRGVFA